MESSTDGIVDDEADIDELFEYPQAVPLVKTNSGNQLILREDILKRITQNEKAKNLPVAIICIVGKTRTGKSFLLNYLLKYLNSINEDEKPDYQDKVWWKADLDDKFLAKGGSKPVTDGIYAWNEPIVIRQNKEKLAVLLLDTMGTNDLENDESIWRSIITLSAMISSVKIINIKDNLDPPSLVDFEILLEYAKHFQKKKSLKKNEANDHQQNEQHEETEITPFQGLIFLIRDWANEDEVPFGVDETLKIWFKVLKMESSKKDDLISITKCFAYKSGFTLCHPNHDVMTGKEPDFDSEPNKKFFELVDKFFRYISQPSKLIPFRRHGHTFKLKEFHEEFRSCFKLIKTQNFQFDSLIKTQAEKTEKAAIISSLELFKDKMSIFYENGKVWKEQQIMLKKEQAKKEALDSFEAYERVKFDIEGDLKTEQKKKLCAKIERATETIVLNNRDLHTQAEKTERAAMMSSLKLFEDKMSIINQNGEVWKEDQIRQTKEQAKKEALKTFEAFERVLFDIEGDLKAEQKKELRTKIERVTEKILRKNRDLYTEKVIKLKEECKICLKRYDTNMKRHLDEVSNFEALHEEFHAMTLKEFKNIAKQQRCEDLIIEEVCDNFLATELKLLYQEFQRIDHDFKLSVERRNQKPKEYRGQLEELIKPAVERIDTDGANDIGVAVGIAAGAIGGLVAVPLVKSVEAGAKVLKGVGTGFTAGVDLANKGFNAIVNWLN